MQFPFSYWKQNGIYLPQVGPFAGLTPPLVSSLSDLNINDNLNHFTDSSLSNPIKVKNLTVSNSSGFWSLAPRYSIFIWADTVQVDSGSAIGSSVPGLIYNDGSSIDGFQGINDGTNTYGGYGGAGGSGGGGGSSCSPDTASGSVGGVGSYNGMSGNDGIGEGDFGHPGAGGFGSGASDMSGNSFTTLFGGTSGNGNPATQAGIGAAGDAGTVNFFGATGGGGAGGAYTCIICRSFIGPAGTAGIYAAGGAAGTDSGDFSIDETAGGGGGVIELFAIRYTGSFVPLNSGGAGSYGTLNGSSGPYRIYELDKIGTSILATHTNELDTWNNL